MRSIFKFIGKLILFGVVLFYSVKTGMSYMGYCFAQQRYLSDQEKIDRVVQEILNSYPPTLVHYEKNGTGQTVMKWINPEDPIYYDSVEDFLSVNGDCCVVTDIVKRDAGHVGDKIPLIFKMSGKISDYVIVRYLVRYKTPGGNIVEEKYDANYAVTNCGYVWSGI